MDSSLVSQKIRFLVGEPWNFHASINVNSSIGRIVSAIPSKSDWIVFEWRFRWEEKSYQYGSACNRYVGDENLIGRLSNGKNAHCNMIMFEEDSALGNQLPSLGAEELNRHHIDYITLKEKLGLIGSIQLASVNPPAWKR